MNIASRTTIWMIAGAMILGALYLGYRKLAREHRESAPNPFAYDVAEYRNIDPALMMYELVNTITLHEDDHVGLALTADGDIAICSASGVFFYRPNGALRNSFEFPNAASAIAVDEDERVYLAKRDFISVFKVDGTHAEFWPTLGETTILTSLALDDHFIWAADAGQRLIWLFSRDARVEGYIRGKLPDGRAGGILVPDRHFDLASAGDGGVWVANPGALLVQRYSGDAELLRSWGEAGMDNAGFTGCCNPTRIAVGEDMIVTAEKGIPRVKVYSLDGTLEAVVAAPNDLGRTAPALGRTEPVKGLAVDAAGRIHILDDYANAVLIYQLK